jgi:hypothetical protein
VIRRAASNAQANVRFHAKLGSSFRQHHVAGLEVPVDDASLVRGREGIGDLDAIVEGLVEWQLAGWPRETSNGACFPSERARLSGSGTRLATSMHGERFGPTSQRFMMFAFSLVIPLLLAAATVGARARADCVTFRSTERLPAETAFSVRLPHRLSLRLVPQRKHGPMLSGVWKIEVNPPEGITDFIWPVSPPFQTAPHLYIGETYGWTAQESVGVERQLRFVVDENDYEAAAAAAQRRDPGEVERSIAQFGKGTLRLVVTGFSVAHASNGTPHVPLEWITFRGEACVPRGH